MGLYDKNLSDAAMLGKVFFIYMRVLIMWRVGFAFFVDLIIYNGIMFAIGNVNALTVHFGSEPCFAT